MLSTSMIHRLAAGALLVGLAAGTTACSDDDDVAAAGTTTGAGIGADGCDAFVELGAAFASAPQDPAQMQAFGESLVPIVDRLAGDLPASASAQGEVLVDAVATVAETGDPSAVFAPEGQEALNAVGALAHDGCDAEQVEVVAADYRFDGLPEELPAGRVSLELANEGTEEHELLLFRRNDGVDATLDELVEQGPDALFESAAFTAVVFAPPSGTAYTAVDLEPGTYFAICTIPTGGDPEAEPHSAHGMTATVEVVEG